MNPSSSQDFYTYLDNNGTRVFTNIPPRSESVVEALSEKAKNAERGSSSASENVYRSPEAYNSLISKYANYYELDPSLIHSIIATESGFNPRAVSRKGARGLMQLMPETASRLGVEDSFDPEQNIHGGVRYFRTLMDMFNNNLDLSLAAYNAGENLVRRLG
ncbi:MAG: transglycosylase SLT domain-containing protein, partial [Acidobacteriota bacterium]